MMPDTLNSAYLDSIRPEKQDRLESMINTYEFKKEITKSDIIDLLKIAIIDEWLAEFNYFASHTLSKTSGKSDFDPEFKQHEDEERDHRNKIVNRLKELGENNILNQLTNFTKLNSNGETWVQESKFDSCTILLNRYNEELNAIKYYDLVLKVLYKFKEQGENDSTTIQLIKNIKADEETHAKDLKELLIEYNVLSIKEEEESKEELNKNVEI
jgi:ferritin-like protein